MFDVPAAALAHGFAGGDSGTLSGKTLMLPELRRLLTACPVEAEPNQYAAAIVEDNVLAKPTVTTRVRSRRHLREWYALDRGVLLFRALRDLWDADEDAQPLLALLCAAARNAVLRRTALLILQTPAGTAVTPQMLALAAAGAAPGRYGVKTLGSIGRNAAASWQQSGHLAGKLSKVRARARAGPASVTYALLLGYLCGLRGDALLRSPWALLLDAPEHELREHAVAAARQGWVDYRAAGGVTDVAFRHLLRNAPREVTP